MNCINYYERHKRYAWKNILPSLPDIETNSNDSHTRKRQQGIHHSPYSVMEDLAQLHTFHAARQQTSPGLTEKERIDIDNRQWLFDVFLKQRVLEEDDNSRNKSTLCPILGNAMQPPLSTRATRSAPENLWLEPPSTVQLFGSKPGSNLYGKTGSGCLG